MSIADRIKQTMGPSAFVPRAEALSYLTEEEQKRLSEQARAIGRDRVLARQYFFRNGIEPIGYETPERLARAPDGMEKEYLSHNKGHVRTRIKAPMQLHAAANNRLAHDAAAREATLHGATKPPEDDRPEPKYRLTRLDMRFDDAEDGRVLRWMISQYVEDHIAIARRGSGSDGGKVDGAQVPGSRVPFSEYQRAALGRLAFVHKRLAPRDLEFLQRFVEMMAPINGHREALSIPEFVTGIRGTPKNRRLEFAFVEIIWRLAERLHEIYRSSDFSVHIEIDTRY